MSATKYYGKYRGMVMNNIDPMQIGRLQVQVPDVAGLAPATWAMPCTPLAGIQNGMFALPLVLSPSRLLAGADPEKLTSQPAQPGDSFTQRTPQPLRHRRPHPGSGEGD